jgi:hypothetical protein
VAIHHLEEWLWMGAVFDDANTEISHSTAFHSKWQFLGVALCFGALAKSAKKKLSTISKKPAAVAGIFFNFVRLF